MTEEAAYTRKAREKIKEIFEPKHYSIEEEVPLQSVTNNMGDEFPPKYKYKADMILRKEFILEFDSKKLHGTHRRIIHDHWRDRNIRDQIQLKTVRLFSKDILKQTPEEILKEIDYQLK